MTEWRKSDSKGVEKQVKDERGECEGKKSDECVEND